MYTIDLKQITLVEFAEILTTIDLLPGRRVLLNNLTGVIAKLKQKRITSLAALQRELKYKKQFPQLATELGDNIDYIIILNREVNGYVSKTISLANLDVYSIVELKQLKEAGIKTSRDLYDQCLTKEMRRKASQQSGLAEPRIIAGLKLVELVRINGIGPVYAKILIEMGIKSAADYLNTSSQELLANYEKINEQKKIQQPSWD